MTLAVLFTASWPETDTALRLTRELTDQLTAAGAREVHVLSGSGAATTVGPVHPAGGRGADPAADLRAVAELAAEADEAVLLCAGDLVTHGSLLWMLATEPAGRTSALVGSSGPVEAAVCEERGRVVAVPARTSGGTATGVFLGALCVSRGDLSALAAAARRAATDGPAARGATATGAPADPVDLLLAELLAGGVNPAVVRVRRLHAERVAAGTLAAARAAVAAVDEDAARLRLAVKERDDFFTTYFVSSWSPAVTRWVARLGLTPTAVTGWSVLTAVLAALAFWQASRPAMVAGAVLLYLGFVLDCVDGQLARYTRQFSAVGGWLDTMADRAKEFVVYAGLAAGADRVGLPWAWPLAIAAIVLQTVRHMTDAWYGALHDEAAVRRDRAVAAPAGAGGLGERLGRVSNRVQSEPGSAAYWLKRIVVLPIGERWALLCLVAAAVDGRAALSALLAWGLLAAAYTLVLRSLRARVMRVPVLATVDTARHRDDGPLAGLLLGRLPRGRLRALPLPLPLAVLGTAGGAGLIAATLADRLTPGAATPAVIAAAVVVVLAAAVPARMAHTGPLDWLVPAALRAAEYLFVVGVALACRVPAPLVFLVLFVLAMRHYDLTARMEKAAPAAARRWWDPGWDGRVVAFAATALAGLAPAGWLLIAGYLAAVFLVGAVAGWSVGGGRSRAAVPVG